MSKWRRIVAWWDWLRGRDFEADDGYLADDAGAIIQPGTMPIPEEEMEALRKQIEQAHERWVAKDPTP